MEHRQGFSQFEEHLRWFLGTGRGEKCSSIADKVEVLVFHVLHVMSEIRWHCRVKPHKKQHTSPPERWIKHFGIWKNQVVFLLPNIHKIQYPTSCFSQLDPACLRITPQPSIPTQLQMPWVGYKVHQMPWVGFKVHMASSLREPILSPWWPSHLLPAWVLVLSERTVLPLLPLQVWKNKKTEP